MENVCAYLGPGWDLQFVNLPELKKTKKFICVDAMPGNHHFGKGFLTKVTEFVKFIKFVANHIGFSETEISKKKKLLKLIEPETSREIHYYYNTDVELELESELKAELSMASKLYISGFFPEDPNAELIPDNPKLVCSYFVPNAKIYILNKARLCKIPDLENHWRKKAELIYVEPSPRYHLELDKNLIRNFEKIERGISGIKER